MAHASPPEYNGVLEKHPGLVAWVFGTLVLFGFIGALYISATSHH